MSVVFMCTQTSCSIREKRGMREYVTADWHLLNLGAHAVQCESKKVAPPKTSCNIFT